MLEQIPVPKGDRSREAVEALGGYTYQIYLSALAWAKLEEDELLFLEVAEDLARVARNQMVAQQIKNTSRRLTLNSPSAATAIDSLVHLQAVNPSYRVIFVYHTTAEEGLERRLDHRIGKTGGLAYWREVQRGADPGPLKNRVLGLMIRAETKSVISKLSDDEFVEKIVSRLHWRCGQKSVENARMELYQIVADYGDSLGVFREDCRIASQAIVSHVLGKATEKGPRSLSREEFDSLFQSAVSIRISNANLRGMITASQRNVPVAIIDREIEDLCIELDSYRFFSEYNTSQQTAALTERVLDGDLQQGSGDVRCRALGWCARLQYLDSNQIRVQRCLDASMGLPETPEIHVARALIENRDSLDRTVGELRKQETPLARSAAVIRIQDEKGVVTAFEWYLAECSSVEDLDGGGKTYLLAGLLNKGLWGEAFALTDQVVDCETDLSPTLCQSVAISLVARTAPAEYRHALLEGVPLEADRYKLSDHPEDRVRRVYASRIMDKVCEFGKALDLKETGRNARNFALWLRLRDETTQEAAREQLKHELNESDEALSVVNLAVRFGVEVDIKRVEKAIARSMRRNMGKLTFDAASAQLAIILVSPDAEEVAHNLAKHRARLAQCLHPAQLVLMEIQALRHAGRTGDAKRLLQEAGEVATPIKSLADSIIAEADGADPVEARHEHFKDTNATEDLERLVEALEEKGDKEQLAIYMEQLYERTGELRDARKLVQCWDDLLRYDRLGVFLDDNPDVVQSTPEIGARYCLLNCQRGDVHRAWSMIQDLRSNSDSEYTRSVFVSVCIAAGRWQDLVPFASQELIARENRKPEELLRASNLVAKTSPVLARSLVEAAVDQAPKDPNILGAAYMIASNSDWEDEPHVGQWLRSAIELSGDTGPIVRASLDDLVARVPQWYTHQEDIWKGVKSAQLPISLAARAIGQTLTDMSLSVAIANRKQADTRRRGVVPAFHGCARSTVIGESWTVVIEPSALFTLADLGVLDEALVSFGSVLIPSEVLPELYDNLYKAAFHQPSRLKYARELVAAVAAGNLKPLKPEPAANAWLIPEVGNTVARLMTAASVYTKSGGVNAYVVHPGVLTRPDSLGREAPDLGELGDLGIGCVGLLDYLHRMGALSAHDALKAKDQLRLRGDTSELSLEVHAISVLYLDVVAIEYVLELGLLKPIIDLGISVHILPEQLKDANSLLNYEKRADEIKAVIEKTRVVIVDAIEKGLVKVLPTLCEEPFNAEGSAIWSATMAVDRVDAVLSDDRAINANLLATHAHISKPLITSLQVIDRLVRLGTLTNAEESHLRHKLRTGNYLFLPITQKDLKYALAQSILIEGRLVETAEMRALREYVAAVAMSDWFQMPGEVDWLSDTYSQIRTAIWDQWETADRFELSKARSDWLMELCDMRYWIRFRQFDPNATNWTRASQLFLLTRPSVEMSEIATKEFLQWFDQRYIVPLKEQDSSIFIELINLVKDAIESVLEEDHKDDMATAITMGILQSLPPALGQVLLQDQDLMDRSGVPRKATVRISEPSPHFDQTELYAALRKLLAPAGARRSLSDKNGIEWEFVVDADGTVRCTDDRLSIQLPEFGYLSLSKSSRIQGLRSLAEGILPRSDFECWLRRVEVEPLDDADVARLHRDMFDTPDTVERRVGAGVESGNLKWNEVIPTGRRICSRLVGTLELAGDLPSYLGGGLEAWYSDLPEGPELEKAKKALMVCGMGDISAAVSSLIKGKVDGLDVLDWAKQQDAPGIHVAALEVFLPWSVEDVSLHGALLELLEKVLTANANEENSAYAFYTSLFFAVAGQTALGQSFDDRSLFFKHLFITTQVNFLQVLFSNLSVDTAALGSAMRQDRGLACVMQTYIDLPKWPRWHVKYLNPSLVYNEHLGRVWAAAEGIGESVGRGDLSNRLFGRQENSLQAMVSFPISYIPGPLDGGSSSIRRQVGDLETVIVEQLSERPVTDQTFIGLVSDCQRIPSPAMTRHEFAWLRR